MKPNGSRPFSRRALFTAVRDAWTAETSADPRWSAACPSLGQCAVTALVIQDYLGGELMRGEVDGGSHYWNVIQGKTIDLTRDQFARFAPTGVRPRKRDHLFA